MRARTRGRPNLRDDGELRRDGAKNLSSVFRGIQKKIRGPVQHTMIVVVAGARSFQNELNVSLTPAPHDVWKLPELWTHRAAPTAPWKTRRHVMRFPQLPHASSSFFCKSPGRRRVRGLTRPWPDVATMFVAAA